ncbi:MAG: hypothetical protein WC608_01880 [Parcubacteria group bacterium]
MNEPTKDDNLKLLAPIAEHIPEDTKGKVDFFIEIALIFVLGILIGIAVKTEAVKRITMGYNDYQIKIEADRYSISQLEKDLIKKQSSAIESQPAVPENSSSESANQ